MYQSIPECTWVYQSVPECTRVYQGLPECTRVYKIVPESTRVYKSVPEYTRVYKSVPERTRVHKSMPEFTRVYQSIPECTIKYTKVYQCVLGWWIYSLCLTGATNMPHCAIFFICPRNYFTSISCLSLCRIKKPTLFLWWVSWIIWLVKNLLCKGHLFLFRVPTTAQWFYLIKPNNKGFLSKGVFYSRQSVCLKESTSK